MTEDAKRLLVEYADGSPFGTAAVRRQLGGEAMRAARAIESLVGARLARPANRDGATLCKLSARGRDLGSAVLGLRSGWRNDRNAFDQRGMESRAPTLSGGRSSSSRQGCLERLVGLKDPLRLALRRGMISGYSAWRSTAFAGERDLSAVRRNPVPIQRCPA